MPPPSPPQTQEGVEGADLQGCYEARRPGTRADLCPVLHAKRCGGHRRTEVCGRFEEVLARRHCWRAVIALSGTSGGLKSGSEKGRCGGRRRQGLSADSGGYAGRAPWRAPCRELREAEDTHKEKADFNMMAQEEITFTFDTVYVVRKAREDVDLMPLRAYLSSIGDSLVIGEDERDLQGPCPHRYSRRGTDRIPENTARWSWQKSKICVLRPMRWRQAARLSPPMTLRPSRRSWRAGSTAIRQRLLKRLWAF